MYHTYAKTGRGTMIATIIITITARSAECYMICIPIAIFWGVWRLAVHTHTRYVHIFVFSFFSIFNFPNNLRTCGHDPSAFTWPVPNPGVFIFHVM